MSSLESANREANRLLIERWYREVWNEGQEGALFELMHPQAEIYGVGTGLVIGPEGFLPFWKLARLNYSVIQIELDHLFVQGDQAIAHLSNRSVRVENGQDMLTSGASYFRMENGRIVFSRHVIDYLSILGQCGALDLDIHKALFPIPGPQGRER